MGWDGTGAWSTAGILNGTEIPQQAPGDTSQEETQPCQASLTTPADVMGIARETPGSIRHDKPDPSHRESAMCEIIKVVRSHTPNLRKLRIKVARTTLMKSPVILPLMGVLTPSTSRRVTVRTWLPSNAQGDGARLQPGALGCLKQSRAQFRYPKPHPWVLRNIHSFSVPCKQFPLQLLTILFSLPWRTHSSYFIVLYPGTVLHHNYLAPRGLLMLYSNQEAAVFHNK